MMAGCTRGKGVSRRRGDSRQEERLTDAGEANELASAAAGELRDSIGFKESGFGDRKGKERERERTGGGAKVGSSSTVEAQFVLHAAMFEPHGHRSSEVQQMGDRGVGTKM